MILYAARTFLFPNKLRQRQDGLLNNKDTKKLVGVVFGLPINRGRNPTEISTKKKHSPFDECFSTKEIKILFYN